jgi:hypothetical protein
MKASARRGADFGPGVNAGEVFKLFKRHWPAEQITLRQSRAQIAQRHILVCRLNTFSNGLQLERLAMARMVSTTTRA